MDMRFDIAFLDIQMEGMDGISLAKKLREKSERLVLFFVTNYEEYQDDAMDLQAFRYFPKPFDASRLCRGLDKALEYVEDAYVDLYLRDDGSCRRFPLGDVMYVTQENRKVLVQTATGPIYPHEEYEAICEKIPVPYFYRVHKSFYVNLHYVKQYSYSELFLTDQTRIPIADRRQAEFRKYWFEYLRRM